MQQATPSLIPDMMPVTTRRSPRVWPGALVVILMWMAIKVPGWVAPGTIIQFMAMMWGPLAGAVLILAWWIFASRFPWAVRLIGLFSMIVGLAAAFMIGHPSMRMGFIVFGLPVSITAWVIAAVIGSFLGNRSASLLVPIAVLGVWAFLACLRLDGLDGSIHSDISFRWTPTAEDRYLAARARQVTPQASSLPATLPAALVLADGDWPGFRGAGRDGKLAGVRISTNWNDQPPKQLWRHLIGPGWSSCCIIGDRLFTQEQRGGDEVVVCNDAGTGQELWSHTDRARFNEAMGGPGPRATPTFADGKPYYNDMVFHKGHVYGFDGSAFVCFDPETGERNWRADGYGNGQVLLLADADLLLVLSEQGVAALVEARPDAHREIGRFQAINGKTWNHPVIAHGKLFVRNGEEIACYQVQ